MEPRSIDVLVVDDNPADLVLEAIALSELALPLCVDMACGGAEALRLIEDNARRERSYDVVFVDRNMPGLSGEALVRQIRKISAGQRVFICALTGSSLKNDRDEMEKAGVDRVLCKEMCVFDLSERLRGLFRELSSAGMSSSALM